MFNKDNVFITVNEEISSIIQQYIIREIKKVLDKYKSFWNLRHITCRRNKRCRKINKQYKQ